MSPPPLPVSLPPDPARARFDCSWTRVLAVLLLSASVHAWQLHQRSIRAAAHGSQATAPANAHEPTVENTSETRP